MDNIKNDINLREAISRHEQKLPTMPCDLNDRVMKSLTTERLGERPSRPLWTWPLGIAAAVVVAVLVFHFGQEPEGTDTLTQQQIYAKLYPSRQEREWNRDSSPSFEETVAEIEQSGRQLQLAIAEMKQ